MSKHVTRKPVIQKVKKSGYNMKVEVHCLQHRLLDPFPIHTLLSDLDNRDLGTWIASSEDYT
jgi:hypothetical protein